MQTPSSRASGLVQLTALLAVLLGAGAATWAQAKGLTAIAIGRRLAPGIVPPVAAPPAVQRVLVWRGLDVDGDGQDDFANPTGHGVRATDPWGCGAFGAERDGGSRDHEGVDFVATPGQPVDAPISGFVTRIGAAYADSGLFRFVEITNPALRYVSRVFYVDPEVKEGQAVRIGRPLGTAHSLQARYPGITDHVHLEIFHIGGARLDAQRLIAERYEMRPAPGLGRARTGLS